MGNWQETGGDAPPESPAEAQQSAEDGRRKIVLQPAPVLKTITYDVAERGLRFMGVDLDDFMERDGDPPQPQPVPLSKGPAFLDAVLENADQIDLRSMPLDRAQAALGIVAANFFMGCLMASIGQPWNDDDSNADTAFQKTGNRTQPA